MKGKISYIDQNHFLNQAVNMFFSAVKLGILTWGVYGTDSLLQPASSGQLTNYSLSHFLVGFTRESGRLPLVYGSRLVSNIIHAKNTIHTCVDNFTCMKPNSRTHKKNSRA